MEYRNFGSAGVKVSPICIGTAFRGQEDDAICVATIERALELGCNFVDCANIYGLGRSEKIVGKALKDKRQDVVLTTKVRSPMGQGPNDQGLSRFHIMREVEKSLERLQTDYIDIYLMHAYDDEAPIDESLRAMEDLVRQGKVRYVGVSNFTGWQIVDALWACSLNEVEPFICTQSQYNLLHRWEIEQDLMPVCRKYGLGMMTFSPLAVGLLTGPYRRGKSLPEGSPWGKGRLNFDRSMTEQADGVVQKLVDIAMGYNCTPAQVAIAWTLDHPKISSAMIGPDRPEHVEENFGGLEIKLTRSEREALDKASAPSPPWSYSRGPV
jgi:aryl-alcohol dehydrogenase-like predicted oxidoreductase